MVSLDKHSDNHSDVEAKLDFLINEVAALRQDINDLKAQNSDKLYQLDSRFYKICTELQSQLYHFQSEFYNGSRNVQSELQQLQQHTSYSRFINKSLPLVPAFLIGGAIWILILMIIFD